MNCNIEKQFEGRKGFFCEHLKKCVNKDFCVNYCKQDPATWKVRSEQRIEATKKAIESIARLCKVCEYYRSKCSSCGGFCTILTRSTNLYQWFMDGKKCPVKKKKDLELLCNRTIVSQPERHSGLYKKIFMRANGAMVDLVDLYHGQTAFVCASGDSFREVDHDRLQRAGILTMTLNNAGHNFRSTMWTGQDPQYRFMPSIWMDPKILKFTLFDYRRRRFWDVKNQRFSNITIQECPSVIFHKRSSDFKADEWINRDRIVWGTPKDLPDGKKGARSVLVSALHILYFLGFKKVFLIGVDFEMNEQKKYWFDENRTESAIKSNKRVFEHVNGHLCDLQPYIKKVGFNVFNCNPKSRLQAFPFYPLEEALEEAEIDLSDSTKGMYVKRKG